VSEPNKPLSPDLKQIARDIFVRTLAECSIENAFGRAVRLASDSHGQRLIFDDKSTIALGQLKRLRIVAAGKAAPSMLTALLRRLPPASTPDLQGVLVAPAPPSNLPSTIQFFAGGHPLPNAASFAGASAALNLLRDVQYCSPEDTLCIFLISGGASSMMELPFDATISVEDTAAFYKALVHCGATITEMNCVRKHFSAIKGGRLALAAGTAQKLSFLVSDVPAAHLDALGSGPSIPDPTTVAHCSAVLQKYDLLRTFPASVQRFFQSPSLPETPKPGEFHIQSVNLIDSDKLAELACSCATQLGFHAVVDNTCDDWEYRSAAEYLLSRFRQLRRSHKKLCIISTGELSVPIPDSVSRSMSPSINSSSHAAVGGRNQHFALYLASLLRKDDAPIAVLSAGTDGIDGNSGAAGAVVDHSTLEGDYPVPSLINQTSQSPNLRCSSALHALREFNSSTWLAGVGATIVTGPTGNNLRDLRILLSD
jgi:glycerate 2-kinase